MMRRSIILICLGMLFSLFVKAQSEAPVVDFQNVASKYAPGFPANVNVVIDSKDYTDQLCKIHYEIRRNGELVENIADFGHVSYSVRLAADQIISREVLAGHGYISTEAEYENETYTIEAFTLGIFTTNACVDRNRPINIVATFDSIGDYTINVKVSTVTAEQEYISTVHTFVDCNSVQHNDQIAMNATVDVDSVGGTVVPITVVPSYAITFEGLEEGNELTVLPPARIDSIMQGDDYVFSIALTECQQAIDSIVVGGTTLTADEGKYTVANIQSDTTITVAFVARTFTISATAGENGSIVVAGHENANTLDSVVNCGTDYVIEFVPATGYILDSVYVDDEHVTEGIVGNVFTLSNVMANHTVEAKFTIEPSMYGITFSGLAEGDSIVIPVSNDSLYVHTAEIADSIYAGRNFVFGFILAECHQIDSISVNGVKLNADANNYYTIENIAGDTVVNVTYLDVKYTLTISASEHGSVADSEVEVDCGSDYTVTFVPENGYKLGSVMLDGETVTEGISGNNYTLTSIVENHTIEGAFVEIRGPYAEYIDLADEYEVGDTIDFSLKMHANCMYENLCAVGYEMIYIDTTGNSTVINDATRYGVFSYNVNVTDDTFVTNQISVGSGKITYTTDYENTTYNVGAFTLGLFDAIAGRDRTVDYDMIFTTSGHYQFKTTLYTCANGGDVIGTNFTATDCDDLTHYDRVAETCSNPSEASVIVKDINITGATIHTVTATVLGGHGTVEPNGTVIYEAGSAVDVIFTPDEYYALDTVMVNGIMRYPSISGIEYIIDNVYSIDSITENYVITVKYKDVRPYYDVHVEITTAGGTVTPKDTSVVIGSDVTLRVIPNEGYHISQLDIDGNIIANFASSEIIFYDIHEDHEVTISFFPNSIEDDVFTNLSVYPNPNNGQFTVSSDDFEGDVTFQIYSVSGSMMDERSVNAEKIVSFDKSLPAGTYFLRIIADDKVATRKIVVE